MRLSTGVLQNRGQFAAVALALVLAGALCGAIALLPIGLGGDLTHFKFWTRLVTVEGMHAAYSGEYPETYAIYPPVTLATFRVVGTLYQLAIDPSFDLERALASHRLNVLLRLQALLFHILVGLAVLIVARQATFFATAYSAMLAYLLNPGVVLDVAQWGQPDPVFGLFVLLALAAAAWSTAVPSSTRPLRVRGGAVSMKTVSSVIHGGSPLAPWMAVLAGAAIVLAALAKPQAWVFLPLVVALLWRRGGVAGLARGAAAGVAAAAVVALPYLLHDTLHELIGLPQVISNTSVAVSANAHNLWWLASGSSARSYLAGEVHFTSARDPFVGPFSYQLAAAGVVGILAGLALLRAVRAPTFNVVFAAGAYTGFSFFMSMTRIHENHMYIVFPLLAVAAAVDRRLWPLYVVLALTWCANMLLYDFDMTERVIRLLPWPLENQERLDVLVNTLVLALWTAWMLSDTVRAWLVTGAPQPSSDSVASKA